MFVSSDVGESHAVQGQRPKRCICLVQRVGSSSALCLTTTNFFHLLKAAVEHEGSQLAFAKHYGVNRTYLNMVLSGKRPAGSAVAEALGLRKVYAAE